MKEGEDAGSRMSCWPSGVSDAGDIVVFRGERMIYLARAGIIEIL